MLRINNYELTSDKIIAYLSDGNTDVRYDIDRTAFEQHITSTDVLNGTLKYHDGTVLAPASYSISMQEYWEIGKSLRSPVLVDILSYINSNPALVLDVEQAFKSELVNNI